MLRLPCLVVFGLRDSLGWVEAEVELVQSRILLWVEMLRLLCLVVDSQDLLGSAVAEVALVYSLDSEVL